MLTDSEIKNLHNRPSEKKLFVRLRKTMLALMVAAACLYGLSFLAIKPLARKQIADRTGGAVYIQSARLSGLATIQLKGLIVAGDEPSLTSSPIFRSDRVEITFSLPALLKGHVSIARVRLTNWLLSADGGKDGWNFMSLTQPLSPDTSSAAVPLVELEKGAIRVRRQTPAGFRDDLKCGLNGRMVMQPDRKTFQFTLESDGRFGFDGTKLLGQLTIGGQDRENRLSLAGKIQMPEAAILGNSWTVDNLLLDCTYDRHSINLERLAFGMGQAAVNIKGRFEPQTLKTNIVLDADNVRISDTYVPDTLVYSESVLAFLDPGLRGFLQRFGPAGTGDAHLSFAGQLNDLASVQVQGKLVSRDIAVRDRRFPYPLEHISGEVLLAGRGVHLKNLQGKHRDALFSINGTIHNLGPESVIDFRLQSDRMLLDEELFLACGPSTKKVWYTFAPTGAIGLDYHFQQFADGNRDLTIALQLQSVTAVYQHFPYPLENLSGTVVIKPDAITFDRLVSSAPQGQTVSLSGTIEQLQSPSPLFQVRIQGRRIALDPELVKAMPRPQRAYFDLIDINGWADVDMVISSQDLAQGLPAFSAHVELTGESLLVRQFPLQMTEMKLSADMTADRIDLHTFEAKAGTGTVSLSGQLYRAGQDPASGAVCLDLNLDNVSLTEAFWDELSDEHLGAGKLRVEGPVTIAGHYEKNLPADACGETWLTLNCRGNPLCWDQSILGLAHGTVRFNGGRFTFDSFQLNIPSVESLPREIFSQPVLSAYLWAMPSGSVCVAIKEGFVQTDGQQATEADLSGEVFLYEVACGQTGQVQDLSCHVTGRFSGRLDQGRWRVGSLAADYYIDRMRFKQCEFDHVFGTVTYDPDTQVCLSKEFAGKLYGGTFGGSWTVDLRDERKYRFSGTVSQADISRMFTAKGPLQQATSRGLANAELKLEGKLDENAMLEGRLTLKVTDLRIGRQSFLGKVLTAIQLKQPRTYIFSGIELDADVRGKTLLCRRIRIAGNPLIFYGSGSVNLQSEQVDLELVGIDRLFGNEDTIISTLARGLGSAICRVQVKGDFKNPAVDTVYLSVLKQPLDLFKRKEPI